MQRLPEPAWYSLPRSSSFGFRLAVLDREVAEAARRILWKDDPGLPDRVVAATALALNVPLVTVTARSEARMFTRSGNLPHRQ
jgi:predicted nucleic acid-binding protein